LSLLFSALLKIPMQFVILLTGAMLFVYYHFEKPPVVFNPVELRKLEESPLAGQYRELAVSYDSAFDARREAAVALVQSPPRCRWGRHRVGADALPRRRSPLG
ncbi:MAG: sodium:solute symporter, partial [Acidobacteriota bacterium]